MQFNTSWAQMPATLLNFLPFALRVVCQTSPGPAFNKKKAGSGPPLNYQNFYRRLIRRSLSRNHHDDRIAGWTNVERAGNYRDRLTHADICFKAHRLVVDHGKSSRGIYGSIGGGRLRRNDGNARAKPEVKHLNNFATIDIFVHPNPSRGKFVETGIPHR